MNNERYYTAVKLSKLCDQRELLYNFSKLIPKFSEDKSIKKQYDLLTQNIRQLEKELKNIWNIGVATWLMNTEQ